MTLTAPTPARAAPALPAPPAPPDTTLRPATDADAATVLAWRNHPDVRRVMFTDHVISAAEHAAWWQRVRASADHHVLVLRHGDLDCGVVTFTRDDGDGGPGTWLWGFYLDPSAFDSPLQQLRAWSGMETASLQWASDQLKARRLNCEVFAFNQAVLALHKRYRFIERDRYERERSGQTFDVVRLQRTLP